MKIIIIGGGQVGTYLASLLLAAGHEIKLIESRENVYETLKQEYPENILVLGNGSDPEILEKAGIANANVVAAVTGVDEINLVTSTLAKMEFGVARVVARINNPKNKWLFNDVMGVDVAINQADLLAHFVVEEMNITEMFTLLSLGHGNYSIIQMKVRSDAKAANSYIRDLPLPSESILIAIIREEAVIIPKGDKQIMADDEIIIMADSGSRKELSEIFG